MISSFLDGSAKEILSPDNCKSVGREAAKLHEITKNFKINRKNDLSVNSWRKIFNSVKDHVEKYIKNFHILLRQT